MNSSILAGLTTLAALAGMNAWASSTEALESLDQRTGLYTVSQFTPIDYEGAPSWMLPYPQTADIGIIEVSPGSTQAFKGVNFSLSSREDGLSMSQFAIVRDSSGKFWAADYFSSADSVRIREIKQNPDGSFTVRPRHDLKFEIKFDDSDHITVLRYVPRLCWVQYNGERQGQCLVFFNWAEPIRYDWTKGLHEPSPED